MIGTVKIWNVGITVFTRSSNSSLLAANCVLLEECLLLRSKHYLLDAAIGSDAHVIGAAYIDRVYKMVEDVLASGDDWRCDKIRHKVDAEVAATISKRLEDVVGGIAGMTVYSGTS
jgi:hypothetical protein